MKYKNRQRQKPGEQTISDIKVNITLKLLYFHQNNPVFNHKKSMLSTRAIRRQYQENDLPIFKSNKSTFPNNINLNKRENLIQHLFKPQELQTYQQNGKMHILRNIPTSTLGYFQGELLISINKLEIERVELDTIAIQEMNAYNRQGENIHNMPIAVGYILVKENKLEEKKRPFSTYIMPTPINHIKHINNNMFSSHYDNNIRLHERTLRANTHWLPYYPWMWFARHIIMKKGIPQDIAWKITSYFDWQVDYSSQNQWPNQPRSIEEENYFLARLPPNVCFCPKAEKPIGVLRNILVTFQDQSTNSDFGFYWGFD